MTSPLVLLRLRLSSTSFNSTDELSMATTSSQKMRVLFWITLLVVLVFILILKPWFKEGKPTALIVSAVSSTMAVSSTTNVLQQPLQVTSTPAPAVKKIVAAPTSTKVTKPFASLFWKPAVNSTFEWLFESSLKNQTDPKADVYDVDMFDVSAKVIAQLHAQKKNVVCYISVGSLEEWRPDKNNFPASVVGNDYSGWPGENWLDISNLKILQPIMKKRFELARTKGCDGIDVDNIDGFSEDTGFSISYSDQITYNRWLAQTAHQLGLSIGLKNDGEQLKDLLASYDWAIIEDCADQGWCAEFRPFTKSGKAVFQVEYTDTNVDFKTFCAEANTNKFSAQLKHRNLDAWTRMCP